MARPILPKYDLAQLVAFALTDDPPSTVAIVKVVQQSPGDLDSTCPPSWRALTPERRRQCQTFRERLLAKGWKASELNYPDAVRRLKGATRSAYRRRVRRLLEDERQRGVPVRFLAEVFGTQSRVLTSLPSGLVDDEVAPPSRTPSTTCPDLHGAPIPDEEAERDRRMLEEWLSCLA